MSTAKKTIKSKTWTGEELRTLRTKRGMNQSEFYSPLGITQSGASRYESGRRIPAPLQRLITITYGTENQSQVLVDALRGVERKSGAAA